MTYKKKQKILVGLSGGVDSSVAAWKLKQEGNEVIGLFMKNWEDDKFCNARKDLIDAVSIADILDIEIKTVNFSKEYKAKVFNDFLAEYKSGKTPNPDVFCNSNIKFDVFLNHALNLGADYIATGHYAKIVKKNDRLELHKGEDGRKDQSYFLYRLNQFQLSKSLFPIGDLYKREVRELAEKIGLPNYKKKDSTGICFIGERPFKDFLKNYIPEQKGDIVTTSGKKIGTHDGLHFYTIGQRQGLKIGGSGEPWYVVAKKLEKNQLIVSQGKNSPSLFCNGLIAENLTWIDGFKPKTQWVYNAKSRYGQILQPCTIEKISDQSCCIKFAENQWAISPGQSVVIYESSNCLGGGIIRNTLL